MAKKDIMKENKELERICQEYVMRDSCTYDIIKQGSINEYNTYLKNSINGIISSAQNPYKNIMGADYDTYIKDLSNMILKDSLPIEKRIQIFSHAAEGLLIGGIA